MKYIFAIILCWTAFAISSQATTISGFVTNRHGYGIGYCELTATHAGNPDIVVSTTTSRQGGYELELDVGSWTLELDPVQLGEWGYQPFSTVIEVTDTNPITYNIVPLPVEPPIPPALSLSVNGDRFTLLVIGGGGRVFRVERSTDFKTWSYFSSTSTDNGRIQYGSNIIGIYTNRAIFRVLVTE